MINILLISRDDEKNKNVEKLLNKDGFNVICSSKLVEAYDIISEVIFEVIVIDQFVEIKYVTRFISAIREKTFAQIVVLGNEITDFAASACFNSGADNYLLKPKTETFIFNLIRAIIRRSEFLIAKTLTIKAFEFDYEKRVVYFNNNLLDLTDKEFRILLYLVKNNERIVSKEELYEVIWEAQLNNNSDALWAAISRLKKKIKQFENDFSIDSNREGYQLYIREN